MGRKKQPPQAVKLPPGVRIHRSQLQIMFTWCCKQQFVSLYMEPNEPNIAYAGGLVTTINREIDLDRFEWNKHFPNHKNARGQLALPSDATIANLLDEYILHAENELAGVTWDNYSYYINDHLKPVFGHVRVDDFTAGRVRQWIKTLRVSHSTIKSYLSPLRSAFREAVLDEKIKANPLVDLVLPKEHKEVRELRRKKREENPDEVDPFNQSEIAAILAACGHREQEHNMIRFGFWTGLRLEELFAVQWGDINFVNGTARIQRALVKRKGYKANGQRRVNHTEIKGLKTDGSGVRERDILLLPEALAAMAAQKQHSLIMGKWVFLHPIHGTHWNGTNQFYNRWVAILLKAGVRHRRPYQIRHTWASMMLEAGEDEAWVSKMLGHVDTTMARKIYRRFIPTGDGPTGGYRLRNSWGSSIETTIKKES